MKKLLLLSLVGLFALSAQAQSFGVQAGGVLSGMLYGDNQEYSLTVAKTNLKPGFMLGVTFDAPINESMFLNFSVGFKTLGATVVNEFHLHPDSVITGLLFKTNNIYLNATYNYMFSFDHLDVFLEGGAYSGYAISGQKVIQPKDGNEITKDLNIGTDKTDDIIPIDFGFTVGAGIYINKSFKFSVGYQHGLLNLRPAKEDRYGAVKRNRMGYITFAYMFGQN